MGYRAISDYGLIGDMNSAALVSTDGSIDWCCFPRFDSPSVFAAILDEDRGGYFQIAPNGAVLKRSQKYLRNTNVIQTEFVTDTGTLQLTDFMPVASPACGGNAPHEIHRIVRCTRGIVDARCVFQPRLDYARSTARVTPVQGGVTVLGDSQQLTLYSQTPLEIAGEDVATKFTLVRGQQAVFVLAFGGASGQRDLDDYSLRQFEHTKRYWRKIASRITYRGLWKEEVVRSLLVLYLLIYEPTGAIVAAPTTSLPETVGGTRNWDYRYSWLRDSSFTMDALYRLGHIEKADRYLKWLVEQCEVTNGHTVIVDGISTESSLDEVTLDHLEGYRGSRPVRIGNGASQHRQLDVFGEVILAIDTLFTISGVIGDDAWQVVEHFADVVCREWRLKDRGVWEVRGESQHFVYSKIMCWVALDRAVRLAGALGRNDSTERWNNVAKEIKAEVLERGWSEAKQSFVQRYDSETLDASNLMIPFVKFLPASDPRVRSTVDAIMRELGDGPFVRRYDSEETDDGIGEQEGTFTLVSFWLIGNLVGQGRIEQAKDYFEQILASANHVGLLAEMIDPRGREALGNFPQAYSHIGLIHTARNLSKALATVRDSCPWTNGALARWPLC